MNAAYSILIADDHAIVRIGLRILINNIDADIHIEEAVNGEAVIGKLKSRSFDLLILDVNMPQTESFSLADYLRKQFPSLKILIFTMNQEVSFAMRFIKLGVHGYLFKQTVEAEIQSAIRRIREGHIYISDFFSELISSEVLSRREVNPFEGLSDREFEVTLQILKGYSMSEIARTLHLNRSTVGTHKSRVMKKLRLTNTIELINLARKHKII